MLLRRDDRLTARHGQSVRDALCAVPLWLWAVGAAVLVLALRLVPLTGPGSATAVVTRTSGTLLLLVAVTVIAELCDEAGLFDVVGNRIARVARGRLWLLYVGIVAFGLAATTVLSLDTTAVLLTPVVLRVALQIRASTTLFALTAIWLANAGSLILPVSNLTNLLAHDRLGGSTLDYLSVMWLPGFVAALVPVALLALWHRRSLAAPYAPPAPIRVTDPALVWCCGLAVLALVPAFVLGAPLQWSATAVALFLLVVFAVRRRSALGWHLLPWRLVLLCLGLFVAMSGLGAIGGTQWAASAMGTSTSLPGLLQTSGVAAVTANLANNLPAYLLLEGALSPESHTQLLAVLIGVNVGPGLLLHGSLATLLWRERCRRAGVTISAWEFLRFGLVAVPVTVLAATALLWFDAR